MLSTLKRCEAPGPTLVAPVSLTQFRTNIIHRCFDGLESEFEDEDEGEEGDNGDEVGEEEDTNEAEEEGEDEDAADDGDSDVVRCVVTYLSLPLALLRYFFILRRDSLTWMSCLHRRRPTANTDRALSHVAPQNQAQAPHSEADTRVPVCLEGKRSRQSR